MNYFIDFDHTLYNTDTLVMDILKELAKYIANSNNQNFEDTFNDIKTSFKNEKFCDFYNFIDYLNKYSKYTFEKTKATSVVNSIMMDCSKYLFEDSIPFIKYLKETGNKVYLLSYNDTRLYYQALKVAGSGILEFVDGLITTSTIKGDMPLNFKNGVFIDDKPRDLISIFNKKPINIYRIRRPSEKYSNQETNCSIEEFSCLEELKKKLEIKNKNKMEE